MYTSQLMLKSKVNFKTKFLLAQSTTPSPLLVCPPIVRISL